MASSVMMVCAVVLALGAAAMAPMFGEAAVTCADVQKNLLPCANFLLNGGTLPPACCAGVKNLKGAAATTADRQGACKCIKAVAAKFPNVKPTFAAQVPAKCGVSIPYAISPNIDCSTVR